MERAPKPWNFDQIMFYSLQDTFHLKNKGKLNDVPLKKFPTRIGIFKKIIMIENVLKSVENYSGERNGNVINICCYYKSLLLFIHYIMVVAFKLVLESRQCAIPISIPACFHT